MSEVVFLKPKEPGTFVRFPITMEKLEEPGAFVTLNSYWRRRLLDGSVIKTEPPIVESEAV